MSNAQMPLPPKSKDAKAKVKKAGTFLGWFILFLPLALAMGFFYTPLLMIVILMAPGWLALLFDGGQERSLSVCVGSGALGGAMFFLSPYLLAPLPIESALIMVQQPQSWLYSLGGSAAGAGIFYIIPMLVIESVYARNLTHKKYLEDTQKKLIEDWGDGVKG